VRPRPRPRPESARPRPRPKNCYETETKNYETDTKTSLVNSVAYENKRILYAFIVDYILETINNE